MSKDIWHKAGFHEAIDDKLKVSKDGKWVYWTMYGWNIPGKDVHDIGCKWAYLDDLLALETELIRTRKALEIAVDALKRANNTYCAEEEDITIDLTESAAHKWQRTAYQMEMPISIALEQIKELEQKEHFADASKKIEQKDK